MIEKLELKHINGYVPYKVECDKGLIVGSILDDAVWIEGRPRNIEFIGDISLFLRPLSDLTKEIEHDGKRFVPILEIAKQCLFNKKELDNYKILSSDRGLGVVFEKKTMKVSKVS